MEYSTRPFEAFKLYNWAREEFKTGSRIKASKIEKALLNMINKFDEYEQLRVARMIEHKRMLEQLCEIH